MPDRPARQTNVQQVYARSVPEERPPDQPEIPRGRLDPTHDPTLRPPQTEAERARESQVYRPQPGAGEGRTILGIAAAMAGAALLLGIVAFVILYWLV